MMKKLARSLAILMPVLMALGCGAPTKSAGDVANLFTGSGDSLGDKMSLVCADLRNRDASPNLNGMTLPDEDCRAAGRAAQNYRELTTFKFANVSTQSLEGARDEKTVKISTRGQVWLNKSLVGLAGAFAKSLQNNAGNSGAINLPGSAFGGDLVKPTIELMEKISFNQAEKDFSGAMRFRLDGAITVDNEIKIGGKIFEDAIAARIDSTADREFKDSLLKNIQAVVVIVPYAGDVYVDFVLQLEVHSIGTDAVIAGALQEALSGGMKAMLDGMLNL